MKYKYTVLENGITIGSFRFSVISPTCVRIESCNGTKEFEDRPSQVFINRSSSFRHFSINSTQLPNIEHAEENEKREYESEEVPFTIRTQDLIVQFFYVEGKATEFTQDNLHFLNLEGKVIWRYTEKYEDKENLLGTTRTLDFQRVKGRPILELGLISKSGFTVVDDSHSLVFNDKKWLIPRSKAEPTVAQIGLKPTIPGENLDFYFFKYGFNYQQCLKDFTEIAGPVPLIPKWALGLWWSKWHAYTQQELIDLVDTFKSKKLPISALCIDMDWHLVDVHNKPGASSGWTGYTWNTALFPSPPQLLEDLHQRGVRVALNLHPSDGCYPHEDAYKEFAQFMGIDPASNAIICFNIGDPKFTEGYFKFLHHPHEEIGVDMWWIDWQQEDTTSVKSLTPIWWLNHLHHTNTLNKQIRPLTFSRWGGLGSHRYPLGFSGDTVVDWSSLQMLPYITATAANVCYDWWSHDIGGFMWGSNDPDLYIRWFQFGALSPILRLHSTKDEFEEKLPWKYDKGTFAIIKDIVKFRESLIPYIYSIAWRMYIYKDISLVTPTYYHAPQSNQAYACPYQYFFGHDLLVVPFLSKIDPDLRLARAVAWFPPGKWLAFESGEEYVGNRYQVLYGKIDEIPIFAREGAIIPRKLRKLSSNIPVLNFDTSLQLVNIFEIRVFAGAGNEFILFEDDGNISLDPNSKIISISQQYTETLIEDRQIIQINCTIASHPTSKKREHQIYQIHILNVGMPLNVKCRVNDVNVPISYNFVAKSREIYIQPIYSELLHPIILEVEYEKESLSQTEERFKQQHYNQLKETISSFNTFAPVKSNIDHSIQHQVSFDWIFNNGFDHKKSAFKAHVEMATGCGSGCFETPENTFVVLWNYNALEQVYFEAQSTDTAFCCEMSTVPFEKIFIFSREFKKNNNCTISIFYSQKWKDEYKIGNFVNNNSSKTQQTGQRKSILQQLKKIF